MPALTDELKSELRNYTRNLQTDEKKFAIIRTDQLIALLDEIHELRAKYNQLKEDVLYNREAAVNTAFEAS